jgi:hypothetical protein
VSARLVYTANVTSTSLMHLFNGYSLVIQIKPAALRNRTMGVAMAPELVFFEPGLVFPATWHVRSDASYKFFVEVENFFVTFWLFLPLLI